MRTWSYIIEWDEVEHLNKFKEGQKIEVVTGFRSNNAETVDLKVGTVGEILKVDSSDNYINVMFNDIEDEQWINPRNFKHVRVVAKRFTEGQKSGSNME